MAEALKDKLKTGINKVQKQLRRESNSSSVNTNSGLHLLSPTSNDVVDFNFTSEDLKQRAGIINKGKNVKLF